MNRKHALLSPSAAERWLHCTAAPKREEKLPDTPSDFAAEGTLAHAYAARALKIYNNDKDTAADELRQIDELQEFYSVDMDDYVAQYAAHVIKALKRARSVDKQAQLLVESRVALPGSEAAVCYGTADAVIVNDWQLEIFDFKYGKGVKVSAQSNPQMMIYAIGAVAMLQRKKLPVPENIRMTIVQPRLNHIDSYETTLKRLTQWRLQTLMPKIREAASDYGRAAAGNWCRFCRCRSNCRDLAAWALGAVEEFPLPDEVDAATMASRLLPRLPAIKTWLGDVQQRSLDMALSGETLPGWKVVEGRSMRRFTNEDAVAEALKRDGVEDIYKPAQLRPLTDLEKKIGKKRFERVLRGYVVRAPGKPTLAEENDPRPVYSAQCEFSDIDTDSL